jgi:hypothetical protein
MSLRGATSRAGCEGIDVFGPGRGVLIVHTPNIAIFDSVDKYSMFSKALLYAYQPSEYSYSFQHSHYQTNNCLSYLLSRE